MTWSRSLPGEALAAHGAGPDPCDSADRDELMDTPDKLAALPRQAGFVGVRGWSERFVHQWDADQLIAQRLCSAPTAGGSTRSTRELAPPVWRI